MPMIQVRDVSEHMYRLLVQQAKRERRSLSRQVVTVLSRGLQVEADSKARRSALIDALSSAPPIRGLTDPVRLIREDRRR